MSRNARAPPPFSSGNRAPLAAPKAKATLSIKYQQKMVPSRIVLKDDRVDPSKKWSTDAEGREADPKKHRAGKEVVGTKDSRLPPPPPPNAIANMFAKLGHSSANEADMNAWATSSMEDNNATITRAAADLFFRQANRHKYMRALIANQKEIVREVKIYKTKAESVVEEMKSMANAHTLELAKAASTISGLEKKLQDVEKEREIDIDKHVEFLKTLQACIAGMEEKHKETSSREEASFRDGEANGQVVFMKAFMKQVPDFDWGLLSEATKTYAADLQLEIEEETAQDLKVAEEEAHKAMDKEGAAV